MGQHYKHLSSKQLKRIQNLKDEQHRIRRESKIFSNGKGKSMKCPHIDIRWSEKQLPPKIERSYVIENKEISRPHISWNLPKHLSEIEVRKRLAERSVNV